MSNRALCSERMAIERFVGVYDADGGVRGELAYLIGKLRGTVRCALCDITHGALGERSAWKACRTQLAVPVVTRHRNELSDAERAACAGEYPCVLAHADGGVRKVLDRAAVEACADAAGLREKLAAILAS